MGSRERKYELEEEEEFVAGAVVVEILRCVREEGLLRVPQKFRAGVLL